MAQVEGCGTRDTIFGGGGDVGGLPEAVGPGDEVDAELVADLDVGRGVGVAGDGFEVCVDDGVSAVVGVTLGVMVVVSFGVAVAGDGVEVCVDDGVSAVVGVTLGVMVVVSFGVAVAGRGVSVVVGAGGLTVLYVTASSLWLPSKPDEVARTVTCSPGVCGITMKTSSPLTVFVMTSLPLESFPDMNTEHSEPSEHVAFHVTC